MTTPVDLCNKALLSFGAAAIQNLDEATSGGSSAKSIYDDTKNWLLTFYPWEFAKQTLALNRLNLVPDVTGRLIQGWMYGYQLPASRLGPPLKYMITPHIADWPFTDFEEQGDNVYCDRDMLWCVVPMDVDPNLWPATFVKAAIAVLAAELCMPISGNAGILPELQAKAWGSPDQNFRGGFLGSAIQADSRATASGRLSGFPLTDVRYQGGSWW